MNKLVSKKPLILPKIKIPIFLFLFCCSFISIVTLKGQNLNDNGNVHTITANGSDVNLGSAQDFTIPSNTPYNSISFYMRGGSGGSANAGANCSSGGGDGAKVWLTTAIGTGAGELRRGGQLRFVIGKAGANRYSGGTNGGGGGGGGGTGLLYRPNTNADWILLAVAGGGGAAYQGNFLGGCVDSQKGQGGRSSTSGGDGGSNNSGDGGSNGGDGGDGNGSTPGQGGFGSNTCYPAGCSTNNFGDQTGGFGYGVGGSGNSNGGGGGGGYSGGGGASAYENGGGGGSYINFVYEIFGSKEAAGADEQNANGFVEYTFGDQCLATLDEIVEITGLCNDVNGMAEVQIEATPTSTCTNGLLYEVKGAFFNPFFEQNTTGLFTLPIGSYNLRIYDPANTEESLIFQTFAVNAPDNYPPVAKCKDYVYKLQNSTDLLSDAFYVNIDAGSTDNCAIASYSTSINQLSCSNINNPIEVTLTVTDMEGYTSTCESTVNVIEGLPTARCKNANYTLTSGEPITIDVASLIDDGSSTPCGTAVPLSASMTTFDCSNIGINTITLTATGLDGGSDDCTANLRIIDGTAPVLDQSIIPTLTGDCSYQATTTLTATDACEGTILPTTDDPTTFTDTGTYTITWVFEDSEGNSVTQNQTVIISDTQAPIADCDPSSEVNTDLVINTAIEVGTALFNLSQQDIDNYTSISTDNCAIASRTASSNIIDCSDIGTTKVITVTIADESGNTSNCTISYTNIVDTDAPEALCQDITVPLDDDGEASISVNDIDAGSSDFCGGVTLSLDQSNFDCGNTSDNTVTLTVVDDYNNTSSCTANVTIEDVTPPIISCDPTNGQLNAVVDIPINIGSSGYGEWDGGGIYFQTQRSTDNCGIVNGTVSPIFIDCSDIGTTKVFTFTLTDAAGNASSCTATYTNIVDETAPEALCRDKTVTLDASGNAAVSPTDIDNGSSDVCGISSITLDRTDFGCDDVGEHTVTLSVSDMYGNTSTCQATVTVEDDTAPIPVCNFSGNVTNSVINDPLLVGLSGPIEWSQDYINLLTVNSEDNCGIVSRTISPNFVDCSDIGTAKVFTVTLSDAAGNVSSCTITYTNIVDAHAPKAFCQDITIQLDANGTTSIAFSDVDNGSFDHCGISSQSLSQTDFDCSHVGSNSVVMTVEDHYENTSTCTSTVTVEDNTNPTAVCQDITVGLEADGTVSISGADVDGGSSDNCGIATLELDKTDFSCDDVGDHTVTLTVTDDSGNTSSCQATVTVVDDTAPTAICDFTGANTNYVEIVSLDIGASGFREFGQSFLDNVTTFAEDNCGITSLSIAPNFIDCEDIGTEKVLTVTVSDAAGNSSNCTITFMSIVDNTPPEAICKDVTIQLDVNGEASITIDDIDNGSTDVCGAVSVSLDQTNFDCSHAGSNTVTLTVEDDYENTSTCTSIVTVEDNINPIIICQDITVELDDNGAYTLSNDLLEFAVDDNCSLSNNASVTPSIVDCANEGQVVPVLVSRYDVNGNEGTCIANVTVVDVSAPVLICKDVVVSFNGEPDILINSNEFIDFVNSYDNCGTMNILEPANGVLIDCEDIGNDVSFTVTVADGSGNAASCTSNVMVEGLPCDWIDEGGIGCADDLNSTLYDANNETFTLTANNCTPAHPYVEDNIAFVFQELCGDGYIKAYVENVNGNGFAGLILRDGSAAGAKKVALSTNRVNKLRKEVRVLDNYPAWPQEVYSLDKFWIKIERIGSMFRAYASVDDQNYIPYVFQYIQMGDCLDAGMFVYGLTPGQAVTATFSQIEIGPLGGTSLEGIDNNFTQGEQIHSGTDFNVFPNPATDNVNVDLSNYIGQEINISIMNTSGQVIHQENIQELNNGIHVLDVNRFEAGVYYINVQTKDGGNTQKLMIQHP